MENDDRFMFIENIIEDITNEINEREWANPDDPKLERLKAELQELKKERADGVRYRPNF